jgi:hypothetical protein
VAPAHPLPTVPNTAIQAQTPYAWTPAAQFTATSMNMANMTPPMGPWQPHGPPMIHPTTAVQQNMQNAAILLQNGTLPAKPEQGQCRKQRQKKWTKPAAKHSMQKAKKKAQYAEKPTIRQRLGPHPDQKKMDEQRIRDIVNEEKRKLGQKYALKFKILEQKANAREREAIQFKVDTMHPPVEVLHHLTVFQHAILKQKVEKAKSKKDEVQAIMTAVQLAKKNVENANKQDKDESIMNGPRQNRLYDLQVIESFANRLFRAHGAYWPKVPANQRRLQSKVHVPNHSTLNRTPKGTRREAEEDESDEDDKKYTKR